MTIRRTDAWQPQNRSASDGVERLRVATTCGSPLVMLISGRLPAGIAGKVVHVGGAFRHDVNVVSMINAHLFAVDAAAEHSVTNAIAVVVDDLTARDGGAGAQSGVTTLVPGTG
jgi:hypothetical protein